MFSSPLTFARRELALEGAKYAILGVPYDSSESYRLGSRLAPNAIREASKELEDYDMSEDFNLRDIVIADCGDVDVSHGNFRETSRRINTSIEEILLKGAIPVCLGGEHTISHAVVSSYPEKPFYLAFDAHLDFRSDYLNEKFSHACVVRRIGELIGFENILVVGVRSASKEELVDAAKLGLEFVDYERCREGGVVEEIIGEKLRGRELYLSVDMDVFDPKEAPGVCNPEPSGFSYDAFVACMNFLADVPVVGMDVVEVTPLYDSYTPVLTAKLILKILTKIEKGRVR